MCLVRPSRGPFLLSRELGGVNLPGTGRDLGARRADAAQRKELPEKSGSIPDHAYHDIGIAELIHGPHQAILATIVYTSDGHTVRTDSCKIGLRHFRSLARWI